MDFLIGKNKNYKSMIIARVLNHSTMSVRRVNSILFFGGKNNRFYFFLMRSSFFFSLADQKKEEGNQLYLSKNYREALQRYNEAISKSILWFTIYILLLQIFLSENYHEKKDGYRGDHYFVVVT